MNASRYCVSRFQTVRRKSREVFVGEIGVGGNHPLRIQSMTTTDTQDVKATVKQSVALAEAGCEIIRITAPNKAAARALKEIRHEFRAHGFHQPLVADIHFLPSAAMEAVEHVEKVRVNPGNYADRKKFIQREYTDAQYDEELERLHESFSPLVKRCKELGKSMRIGTNHGSLSDRIMNRYGDTPLGMVESALEFLRIAEFHDYRDIILSMKASNPKVMIQAYRMLVERMEAEDMRYPLHLGVTEAGDGEDGRIKSSIGIGSLLLDGLGDTIRVSLTEDPVYEIPVAQALTRKVSSIWRARSDVNWTVDSIDPYEFKRREITHAPIGRRSLLGSDIPPTVLCKLSKPLSELDSFIESLNKDGISLIDTPIEGLLIDIRSQEDLASLKSSEDNLNDGIDFLVLNIDSRISIKNLDTFEFPNSIPLALQKNFERNEETEVKAFTELCEEKRVTAIVGLHPESFDDVYGQLPETTIVTLNDAALESLGIHATGAYRFLAEKLKFWDASNPIWIRNTDATSIQNQPSFLSRLIEASILSGSLLCDGIGDLISIETEVDVIRSTKLAYNVLQGAGARISKTEFVACPSCGRTLFDLQTTTQRIREKTGHLKGVKIAIMGCIVNGPGEMADSDFGYVGGAPGKINLYVGKECVQYNIPQSEADDRLIDLIKQHGKWLEVEPVEA